MVSGTSTTTLTYDDENSVTGITYPNSSTNSFAYNGLGLRVSKNDSAGAFAYVCDGTGVASAVLKDGAATYTPGLSERRGSTSKFTHKDALGSTRGITDTTQTTTDSMLFDAFGMTVSRTGTTPTPFGFVGGAQYQTDADSGLMLLGHRYYDASIGRFISSDPIQDGDNWYAYCENNPLNETDANGLQSDKKGRPKKPTPKKPEFPKDPIWTNPKVGGAIGWGTGESGAKKRYGEISKGEVDIIKKSGIPKDIIEKWRDFYKKYQDWLNGQDRSGKDNTPIARSRLLKKVLIYW